MSVGKDQLQNNAVTTPKIKAKAVDSTKLADVTIKNDVVALTNAEILALRATPKTLVAAPGAGYFIEFISAVIFFDRVGSYTETADNMAIKLGDGSGTAVSETIEVTGLLDAAGDVVMPVQPATSAVIAKAAAENKALVLHNIGDGEYGGGNAGNEVLVRVTYRILPTGF